MERATVDERDQLQNNGQGKPKSYMHPDVLNQFWRTTVGYVRVVVFRNTLRVVGFGIIPIGLVNRFGRLQLIQWVRPVLHERSVR